MKSKLMVKAALVEAALVEAALVEAALVEAPCFSRGLDFSPISGYCGFQEGFSTGLYGPALNCEERLEASESARALSPHKFGCFHPTSAKFLDLMRTICLLALVPIYQFVQRFNLKLK